MINDIQEVQLKCHGCEAWGEHPNNPILTNAGTAAQYSVSFAGVVGAAALQITELLGSTAQDWSCSPSGNSPLVKVGSCCFVAHW